MGKFSAKTQDAPTLLSAEFWQKGTKIEGEVIDLYETKNGGCFVVLLKKPIQMEGQTVKSVSIGNLAGVVMAVRASGAGELKLKDNIVLTCTGHTDTGQRSNRVDFTVDINRD